MQRDHESRSARDVFAVLAYRRWADAEISRGLLAGQPLANPHDNLTFARTQTSDGCHASFAIAIAAYRTRLDGVCGQLHRAMQPKLAKDVAAMLAHGEYRNAQPRRHLPTAQALAHECQYLAFPGRQRRCARMRAAPNR
ncbi:MAG: hypothetical protein ABI114_11875 [Rhodanobacter sp.]